MRVLFTNHADLKDVVKYRWVVADEIEAFAIELVKKKKKWRGEKPGLSEKISVIFDFEQARPFVDTSYFNISRASLPLSSELALAQPTVDKYSHNLDTNIVRELAGVLKGTFYVFIGTPSLKKIIEKAVK